MNLKRSQAMAPMQKDDMKIGKFCAAIRNLQRNSESGKKYSVFKSFEDNAADTSMSSRPLPAKRPNHTTYSLFDSKSL